MTLDEQKDEIAKQIRASLEDFVGSSCNNTSKAQIEAVLINQLKDIANRGIINLSPIPKVEINGNVVNITFLDPIDRHLLTEEELFSWATGK